METKRTIGIGIIGMGWMGMTHARAYRQIADRFQDSPLHPKLIICADDVVERTTEAKSRFGFERTTTDFRDVIADENVQLVNIAAPNSMHLEIVEAAAASGKHVFCEKPVGRNPAETKAIYAAAQRAGVLTYVGYNYRWAPVVQYAQQLISDGKLGKLTHYRGRFFAGYASHPRCANCHPKLMGGGPLDFYLTIKQALYYAKKLVSVPKFVKLESRFNTIAILAYLITFLIFFALNADAQNLPQFTDITHAAGINFIHNSGAFGQKYLPETMGSGCAFIDYDTDGWQDILFVNGKDWEGNPTAKRQTMGLYRNNRDGTFTDVTESAGLAVPLYGMGAAVADYDNDGDPDIYISCLETDRLFKNNGDGTFVDATEAAGIHNPGFGTSCAWFDYNNDGHLDLYVANYVEWSIENDLFCTLNGINKSYCTPESYQGQASKLFRNRGNGTFADVSRSAGIEDKTSKSLGVCIFDYNADGLPDIFEANDTQPNKLYQNNGDGTFIETALEVGVSHDEKGVATGAMGVDAADYDRTGKESLIIGNFSNEMLNLYHNDGGFFMDDAPAAQIGNATLLTLTFACFFFDFDLDGNLDIFTANGHVENDINAIQTQVTYAQPPHLFHNNSHGKFSDALNTVGMDLAKPMVGRGAAYGDIDNDGDWDLLVTTSNGPAHLFRNDGGNRNAWIKVQLIGQTSNRDGIGAQIRITTASGTQTRTVKSGSSYCSQSELTAIFGINDDTTIETIKVKWPSSAVTTRKNIKPNQRIRIEEGTP